VSSYASVQVQGDTFQTMRALLAANPALVREFFTASYDAFFARFNALLATENFITRKEALKVRVGVTRVFSLSRGSQPRCGVRPV
jgi:hypothetical protein